MEHSVQQLPNLPLCGEGGPVGDPNGGLSDSGDVGDMGASSGTTSRSRLGRKLCTLLDKEGDLFLMRLSIEDIVFTMMLM